MAESGTPALSVVVAIVSDTFGLPNTVHLGRCLAALAPQAAAGAVEILVPFLPGTDGIARLSEQYPDVRFAEAAGLRTQTGRGRSREHHDELRALGLTAARGRIVALIEDHGIPQPNWCARVIEGHEKPAAALGGAIENGVDRLLNWAVYFCDFLRYQNPLPEGEAATVSDANVSYKRSALEAIRPVWQDVFQEHSVNAALRLRGEKLAFAPDIVVSQHRQGLRLMAALKERFIWGRSYAAARARLAPRPQRLFWSIFAPLLPALILTRMILMAWKKRRTVRAFMKALPLTAFLVIAWSCGEFAGYATGHANGTQRVPAV